MVKIYVEGATQTGPKALKIVVVAEDVEGAEWAVEGINDGAAALKSKDLKGIMETLIDIVMLVKAQFRIALKHMLGQG